MTITEIRQTLHEHPGVSGNEEFAHDLIVGELKAMCPDEIHEHVGGFGVIALWRSKSESAKTLAFRADIDALPSGHRCGHDGHTAILLRFAQIVGEDKDRKNNIVAVFQPEEETGKGARKIMESGILQRMGVHAIFGLHNLPGYDKATVVLSRGAFAAASSGVIYRFTGRQTHASTPENGLNPGLAIAELIQQVDGLNKIGGEHFCFSTLICCRIGEEAFGTSAGKGEVMFTMRASESQAFAELTQAVDNLSMSVAEKYSLKVEKQVREPFRALENTPELVDKLETILQHTATVIHRTSFRWSEDFAEYLTQFKGAFFGLGSGNDQPELHHPDYNFPDDIIETGAKCFQSIANAEW